MHSPVLFLIFNRPDLTARTFAQIRKARPPRLYVAADGARSDRVGEAEQCALTREVTENVDWPCEVHRLYRDKNLSCKYAVSGAITWFFEQESEGIILEDDCLPESTFFPYCDELLKRYRDDERIGMVTGLNLSAIPPDNQASYFASKHSIIWGWATWKRVWQQYDLELTEWQETRSALEGHELSRYARRYLPLCYDLIVNGHTNAWGIQMDNLLMRTKMISLVPAVNQIRNIGFDERAAHTTKCHHDPATLETAPLTFPLNHPRELPVDHDFDKIFEHNMYLIPRDFPEWFRYRVVGKVIIQIRVIGGRVLRALKIRKS